MKIFVVLGTCMCVKHDGNYLVAGFEEGSIALFDYRKQAEAVTEFKAHDEPGKDIFILVVANVFCMQ